MRVPVAIPTAQREAVKRRDRGRCVRCGGGGAEWHHRRTRKVRDEHTHCTCNGVWLCPKCHRWAHAGPAAARDAGFIVSSYESNPGSMPVDTWHGHVYLTCSATFTANGERDAHEV